MGLAELLDRVAERTGKSYSRTILGKQPSVSAMRILGPGPGTGTKRNYTEADVERIVAWLRMNKLGGEMSSGEPHGAIRHMVLDLIPEERELGSIVLTRGIATWGLPTVEDVESGMMAIWVYD